MKKLLCIALLALPLLAAEQKTSNAPFLSPAEAVAKMDVPEGFDVSVFVAEPDIGEPIAFTFDPRGRIWVVENYNYVNRRFHIAGQKKSRIQIFEDRDNDGVFDHKKLFMEDLPFASGIAVGFGGVYLGAPPNLQFIPDANGDDKPDGEGEVLLDGWGIQDRHETLNSFLWGPDGWLYGCHGVFTQSLVGRPGTADKDRLFIDGGIWRFHPQRKEFEIFAEGLSNPWGFDFNDLGHGFATCCVIPHLFHVVQGGVFTKQSRAHVNPYVYDDIKTIRDHTHKSAHGGARFYLADSFPASYRDQLFMCNIHEHAVLTDIMVPRGSGYIGQHGADFMPTHDLAWVGFSVEIGPDGGVYILDWHDTDICGNKINFPDSGRVYRIQAEGAPKVVPPNLYPLSDLELVELQTHVNDWYVRQARMLLQGRAVAGTLDRAAVHAALDRQFDAATTSPKRLRALWAQHVCGRFEAAGRTDLEALLSHTDEHVRAWVIQLLCEVGSPSDAVRATLAKMAADDASPTVRLYLAAALQRLPMAHRWEMLAALSQHESNNQDHNLPTMLWLALEPGVVANPDRALALAIDGKMPHLQECVARRMLAGDLVTGPRRGPLGPEVLAKWRRVVEGMAPGFDFQNVGQGGIKQLNEFRNQRAVQTHPKDRNIPCRLTRHLDVPAGKTTTLKLRVSYHPHGDWKLRVLANKEVLIDRLVNHASVGDEWLDLDVDLTRFAGKHLDLVLENAANGWSNEFGYWGSVRIVSE